MSASASGLCRRDRGRLRDRVGRVLLDARTVGLRQDHDAADDRRLREPDRAPSGSTASTSGNAAAQAQRQHGLPALRAVPAHDGVRQHRLRAAQQKKDEAEVRKRVDEMLESCGSPTSPSAGPPSSRAASASASRWPVRWWYPSALLLDEPLSALDVKLRQVMQIELKRIQREVGITFVYVTHDQEEALTMSDRIAVMSAGMSSRSAPRGDLSSPGDGLRRRLHRSGQPVGRQADRQDQPRLRRSRGSRNDIEGPARRNRDRTGWPGHADGAPERVRVSMDAPTGDVATVRAKVRDLTFQGPVPADVAGRPG